MTIVLSGSVGAGGINNSDDVIDVQERLIELGFTFIGRPDGIIGPNTIHGIRLFQSIKNGAQTLGGDGRVDVGGDTLRWLNAANAPEWQQMTAQGTGFENIEVTQQHRDDHDFGTSWLDETVIAAARLYQTSHRDANVQASLMTINDTSHPRGGNTRDHSGHETGLSCDLRLPQVGNPGPAQGGRTFNSNDYDQAAARMVLVALRAQPLANTRALFFNDPQLIAEGLCRPLRGHDDHIHFQIRPPAREDINN